jgi:hypothetical protein
MGIRMNEEAGGTLQQEGVAALVHMEKALGLIDRCQGTSEVGAHLDLAICRLRDLLARHAPMVAPRPRDEPHL